MRRYGMMFGLGITLFLGVLFFLLFAPVSRSGGAMPAGPMTPPWILIMILAGVVLLGILFVAATLVSRRQSYGSDAPRKRKHDERVEPGPFLDHIADDDRLILDDDGELPEWLDTLSEEKPKRS
ncbi:MAG: hypothetical protein Kow0077_00760 [Anaerolineae bacterium]